MDIKSDDCSQNVGIGRNLNSDDDFDEDDVVIRRHSSRFLLADGGDGSEADLLGTTPPRSRIRNKEIRKNNFDSAVFVQRAAKANRNSDVPRVDPTSGVADRLKKRASLKLFRSRERDWKQDMGQRDQRSESLPSPSSGVAPNLPAVPTLVESCNRFMCLTSRLKSRDSEEQESSQEEVVERRYPPEDEPPASRVTFHKTFSMLINMGNIEKGCRRTISREEQVWQNELKDLIWLELQAKIAGRSLAQQDSYLCAQRDVVPSVLQNIMDYKFVNPSGCRLRSERLSVVKGSQENLTQHPDFEQDTRSKRELYEGDHIGCLSFNCRECTDAIGKAMKEIGALLDSFYNAVALYPSSKAMTVEHPLVATDEFKNRIKAMCLWFNTALHMRLKLLAVRRLVRTLRPRAHSLRKSSTPDSTRLCQVRFNVSDNSNDSYISDSSGQSDSSKDIKESEIRVNGDVDSSGEYVRRQCDAGFRSYVGDRLNADEVKHGVDEVDNFSSFGEISNRTEDPPTPEIVISDKYGSSESGYLSGADSSPVDVFSLGPMADLSRLRLLGKCDVSPYRAYHYEMLKTQGVRRCMTFINKLRKNVLCKVHITLEKPDSPFTERVHEEETSLMFEEPNKTEDSDAELPQEEDLEKTYELRRYGCWSEESLAMRLPSYRNHFLVLSSICMEAVHDYLSLRLESSPERPSCLTVKQLIHELKEGLDISTEMRHDFVRNVEVALRGVAVSPEVRGELLLLLRTYDATVHSVLRQYLGYLRMMSEKEPLGRAWLRAEWAFTARLAARDRPAALLAPAAFAEISCNQISRLLKEFKNKFDSLIELEKSVHHTPNRYTAYVMCRAVQEIYARWREPLLHAAAWARALAAKLTLPRWAPQREAILNSLMSMREFTLRHTEMVLERTRVPDEELELTEGLVTRVRELLLQMFKLGFEIHKELYRVVNDVSGRAPLTSRRSVLNSPPKGLKPKFARSESIGEENVFDDRLFDSFNSVDGHKETIERLLSGEDKESEVGVSGNVEGGPATEGREAWQAKVGRALVQFAHCWMKFVVGRVERGRGLRPRWASQGLEFLMLACEPCNTKHLTDQEFEELKQQMDGCISHVVGSRRETAQAPRTRHRLHSPTPNSPGRVAPPTPPTDTEPPLSFHTKDADHQSRVCEAIYQLDAARDEKLRELKAVGSVVDVAVSSYQPKLKQVTFKWQRGLKIGAGTFGKVYTVVNTESGQVLAMKEVSVGAGDRRALQRAANELQVLEGVLHPHLVRYYGCELHREEMLIFMELCVEGSLEALVATCGGLQEPAARRYTGQLVAAVGELHARGIAHRDIKSGNIFLTNEGHCLKLGDFGCAVKIRANTTAPGELQGFVGTQAYMAPEVFMKSSGHGRAADVWSLGCVVTEMASGKRPFSEYDSNYQIMFVVGMGGRPDIPPSLSEEGRDFCRQCLSHDPDNRPRAETLSLHHFLMVSVKDDNKCTIGNFVS